MAKIKFPTFKIKTPKGLKMAKTGRKNWFRTPIGHSMSLTSLKAKNNGRAF